jgi:hypothetical protein
MIAGAGIRDRTRDEIQTLYRPHLLRKEGRVIFLLGKSEKT